MIKNLCKILDEKKDVASYKITKLETKSYQAFFVLGKLETTRVVNTTEYECTIYRKNDEFLGQASFTLSHKASKKEINSLIDNALFSASFVNNKSYELVKGEKKRSFTSSKIANEPFEALNKVAEVFIEKHTPNCRFNALELFYDQITTTLVNSLGVNYKKTEEEIKVEAIPSFDGDNDKVELYKFYNYDKLDFEKISNDAKIALDDVKSRYEARKLEGVSKIDVVLSKVDAREFFDFVIGNYSYASIYKGMTEKRIGDMIQEKGELNLSLVKANKADGFDKDGVLLNDVQIISNGKLVSYFGDNQYAQYLNINPTGNLRVINVSKGDKPFSKMIKRPFLEIIALSGIQIEEFADYIGGEIRLAIYHDGKKKIPVSGLSFSGSFKGAIESLELSKETEEIKDYKGPKYILLKDMDVL